MTTPFIDGHIEDLLPAYHNGTLTADERRRVEVHLRRCAACLAASAEWDAIAGALRRPATAEPSSAIGPRPLPLDRAAALAIPRRQRPRLLSTLAPVALFLLLLSSAVAVIRLAPEPGHRAPATATLPALAATVASSGSTPFPIACTTQPGSLDRLLLTGAAARPSALEIVQDSPAMGFTIMPEDIPAGQPAAAEQAAGVTATVGQLVACVQGGSAERVSMLFTDDYWRRLNAIEPVTTDMLPSAYFPSLAGLDEGRIPSVQNVIVLPDGRVGALLVPPDQPTDVAPYNTRYAIFALEGGRWLIDEAAPVTPFERARIAITDTGFAPPELRVSGGPTLLSVTNQGSRPHRLDIPQLRLGVEVAPGQTKEIRLRIAGTNEFRIESTLQADLDAGGFVGTLIVDPSLRATPGVTPAP